MRESGIKERKAEREKGKKLGEYGAKGKRTNEEKKADKGEKKANKGRKESGAIEGRKERHPKRTLSCCSVAILHSSMHFCSPRIGY